MSVLTPTTSLPRPIDRRCGSPADADEPLYRLTVAQYDRMVRDGILTSDDSVELLEGLLVEKMPKNPGHRVAKMLLRDALSGLFPSGWFIAAEDPFATSDSELEPDLTIVRGRVRDYTNRHPGPADVAFVVEVSDTTLRHDRGRKKRIYARAEVSVYWIVNLIDCRIEVYTAPSGPDAAEPDYAQMQSYGPDDALPVILDGNEVGRLTVRDLLP